MKKLIHILVIAFIVGLVCVSCRESDLTNNGEGALSLKIGVQRELPTVSAGKRELRLPMKNCFRSVKCISVTRRAWCVNSPLWMKCRNKYC